MEAKTKDGIEKREKERGQDVRACRLAAVAAAAAVVVLALAVVGYPAL